MRGPNRHNLSVAKDSGRGPVTGGHRVVNSVSEKDLCVREIAAQIAMVAKEKDTTFSFSFTVWSSLAELSSM